MKCFVLMRGEDRTIVAVTTSGDEAMDWVSSEVIGANWAEVELNGNFRKLLERETDR